MQFNIAAPRRCVNLPPGIIRLLIGSAVRTRVAIGPEIARFQEAFAEWVGAPYAFGAATGRSSFQLAIESLGIEKGAEVIFPTFTFPVIPMAAKMLGYKPVFCDVDPDTFNAGPEHIEPKLTEHTGAIVATHLFGQPCPIREIVELARGRGVRVMEDCAHANGARVAGRMVGTFGDIGIFSFAEGKNMPCFGGGAIVTSDEEIARRAREILAGAETPLADPLYKTALSVWGKGVLTHPTLFTLTVYPVLRLKEFLHQPLMDSVVGDELLAQYSCERLSVTRMGNLQAATGLLQLKRIAQFNEGARRNGKLLNELLEGTPGIEIPRVVGEDHIFVYYPIRVAPEKRDDLRAFLLRRGIDAKKTDMSECSALKTFAPVGETGAKTETHMEDSILEICVYPMMSEAQVRRMGRAIQDWARQA